ncbi:MAG: hypothetical protein A2275_06760 [Bacteroidetes bacterium RIFOXYA12_FULL_35_11]|nr:MAG: hypothetical protein A2X01_15355 [Bacteroidetes bacterium GWF2_35_48]OFY76790.1 MAG: hypothetical protein A2275_06760 [Bacteroidetes bacterium RIFOXYA12_FULL_35_11]OFY94672.1 MAG: hypothetical protein A2309_09770 [Bacteroidetes bacterium RIFOXYB2_FULL_35_7]OFY98018.1 MAG: hypothetical protein A2491_18875 [Bacteroidetes bacterium RIFOXYC12_FULL_35_7]HBX49825.1 hypothetical protein [Bacteroidales bacterium]
MKKKINILLITFISITVFTFVFSSCKSKKQVFHFKNVKPMRASKVFDNVNYRKFRYQSLSLKFSATYEKGEESQSFSGTLRIKRDSAIWVSIVPALGIEAVRLIITPDSVKFINRINSTYYLGNYNYIRNLTKMDLDYNLLQSVLSNEMFFYTRTPDDEDIKGFKSYKDSNLYVLQSLKERKLHRKVKKKKTDNLIFIEVAVLPEIFKIVHVYANDHEYQKSMDVIYSDFENVEDQLFPMSTKFTIKDKETVIKFNLSYTKATLNKKLEYPFSVPEKYLKMPE